MDGLANAFSLFVFVSLLSGFGVVLASILAPLLSGLVLFVVKAASLFDESWRQAERTDQEEGRA